jgi:hypothetical protein
MPLTSQKPVAVKRVGTSLVAAFHKAKPPLVWRFDLERNHSFSLALHGAESDWQLGLTMPTGEFQTIAHFAMQADAQHAFTETEKILAQGKPTVTSTILKIVGLLGLVFFIAIVIFGFLVQNNYIPKPHPYSPIANTPGKSPAKPEAKSGVPLPADEFLTPPSP